MCQSPRPRHCACCLPSTISQTPRFSDVVVGIANTGCYSHDALPSAMRTGYMKTAPSLCIFQILTLMRVSGTGKQVNRGRRKVEHRAAVEDGSFGASIAISGIQRHHHVASIELTPVNSRTYARPSSGLVHQPLTLLYPLNSRTLWRLTHLWRLSNSNNHSRSFASNGNEMRSLSMHWVSPNHPAGSRNS